MTTSKKYGKLVTNPPTREAAGEKSEVHQLYRELAESEASWTPGPFTSSPPTPIWKRSSAQSRKRRKLYNGNLETQYYQYYGPRPPRRQS